MSINVNGETRIIPKRSRSIPKTPEAFCVIINEVGDSLDRGKEWNVSVSDKGQHVQANNPSKVYGCHVSIITPAWEGMERERERA